MPNHVHIFVDLHQSVSLSEFVGVIKRESSRWMKSCGMFPHFQGWGKEYFATSKSVGDKDVVIEYIRNQVEHHCNMGFEEEIRKMFALEGWNWDDSVLT